MADWTLKTPVTFFIFNRPKTTERVFEAIRQAQPPKLFVIADSPRPDKPEDIDKCKAAKAIIDRVDWNCEVVKNYADQNLGCGRRISSGITWVFEQVEEAIFLEDDCLPNLDFFYFCEQMLDQYREDRRVMTISGSNLLGEWKSHIQSYHFSYYGGIWGWASWRRAWQYFDYQIKLWVDDEIRKRIRDVLASDTQFKTMEKIYWTTYNNSSNISWWAYQWGFAHLVQSGLFIVPAVNLIRNIGFSEDATHTASANSDLSIPNTNLSTPYKWNEFTAVDREFDRLFYNKIMKEKNLLDKIQNKVNRII
ncbi:hypothetical protein PN462_22525 [Spirulina sp. CS-785/01]|uniref:hypothetical protein n=1 Tax=Spirulina sp. CS-785/01 TaxID=3021716 RepID=UPI00232FF973|nr:hypothetical protein [Spirulina sp. CS-785/01]MDB9315905.1 hypothetical protein [Spirulina sp. CS-785/01]